LVGIAVEALIVDATREVIEVDTAVAAVAGTEVVTLAADSEIGAAATGTEAVTREDLEMEIGAVEALKAVEAASIEVATAAATIEVAIVVEASGAIVVEVRIRVLLVPVVLRWSVRASTCKSVQHLLQHPHQLLPRRSQLLRPKQR
jgi:hypothetical protein